MSQLLSSAWKIFNSSLELAQRSSDFLNPEIIFEAFFIIGIGFFPVSAILPANIEIIKGVLGERALIICLTCSRVKTAVMFNLMPSQDKDLTKSKDDFPFVLVIGILT